MLARRVARGAAPITAAERAATARWYRPVGGTNHWNAWLIGWPPGTGLTFHDHGPSAGAFLVIEGELVESIVSEDGTVEPFRHSAGAVEGFGPSRVHAVDNSSSAPAVSVHVYAPRLDGMQLRDF